MADKFQLTANARTESGTGVSRRLRRAGLIPAVIYGAGKNPEWISLSHKDISHALNHEAFYSHILTIQVDGGKSEKVVLKDLLRHPFKRQILHADFLRVNASEKLTMNVPIHFAGEESAPGVKAGGVLSKQKTEVEIRCLPANLPEFIEMDISTMKMDQTLHLSDLKLPQGVELALLKLDDEHNLPIASIHQPRAAKEATPAAETTEATPEAEPA
jgi:large subunit ribosomal protein L25